MKKEQIDSLFNKTKHFWNKSKTSKAILVVLGILLWPLILLFISSYLYRKFENPLLRWGSISTLLILTAPITIAWGEGVISSLRSSREEKVAINAVPTPQEGNCVGPDGKRLWLSNDECKKFNDAWRNSQQPQQQNQQASAPSPILTTPTSIITPTPSNEVSITSTPTRELTSTPSPYEILSKIGKQVAGTGSSVSIFKNDDGSIDVINNIQFVPEITWGLEAETRKMVTDFLTKSYSTDLNIRYILVTVSYLHTGIPATRVGVGINQVNKFSKEEWREATPYDLCNWLKGMQIGDDVDPIDPYFDPSNWAFAKNYKCS